MPSLNRLAQCFFDSLKALRKRQAKGGQSDPRLYILSTCLEWLLAPRDWNRQLSHCRKSELSVKSHICARQTPGIMCGHRLRRIYAQWQEFPVFKRPQNGARVGDLCMSLIHACGLYDNCTMDMGVDAFVEFNAFAECVSYTF